MSSATTSSSVTVDAETKKNERLKRIQNLRLRQNEARKMNHKEVVEEDRKLKLPANWEKQQERFEFEDAQEKKRKEMEAKGLPYERMRFLDWTADECDTWDRKKAKKHNPDTGFADYEQASFRQYERLTKQMQPDMENYEKQKDELGADFYADTTTLSYGTHKPSSKAIDSMVSDLDKQIDKKTSYSRKRALKANADIDFINERNMRFNRKIDRAYGRFTTEIKQNLERGTAV